MKFETEYDDFYSRKCIWEYRLHNGVHFVHASVLRYKTMQNVVMETHRVRACSHGFMLDFSQSKWNTNRDINTHPTTRSLEIPRDLPTRSCRPSLKISSDQQECPKCYFQRKMHKMHSKSSTVMGETRLTLMMYRTSVAHEAWSPVGVTFLWLDNLNNVCKYLIWNVFWAQVTGGNFHKFFYRPLTFPLNSPDGRQMPDIMAVQGDCARVCPAIIGICTY